ncbi:MAG: ribokinase [Spirochaetales bacterium]
MKILVYGSLNIDSTFILDHIVVPGETLASAGFRKNAGGKGANQAAAIAKASNGKNVYFAGKTGFDGEWVLEKLRGFGLDTHYVGHSDSGTGQAIIQLDNEGQNSIILYGGGNLENKTCEMDRVLSDFGKDDILVINGEINNLSYLFDRASEKSMKICINPSPVTDEVLALPLEKAWLLIVNEIEGAAISRMGNEKDYEQILSALVRKFPMTEIVLTAGKFGSYYGFKDIVAYVPAFETKAVDTTCAGDTFLGYFIACRAEGKSVRQSLETAAKASSITVSRAGAMDSIPFVSEL